jgi:transposase
VVSPRTILTIAAKLRIRSRWDIEIQTYAGVLRDLARRHHVLKAEANTHESAITAIIKAWRPDLLEQFGVGPIVAANVLCAWSHPSRCRNEAAFAKLAGVAPIPANSGLTLFRALELDPPTWVWGSGVLCWALASGSVAPCGWAVGGLP